VKRVCRSTATGEILSLGGSYDTSMWLKRIWIELTVKDLKVRLVVDSQGALRNAVTTSRDVGASAQTLEFDEQKSHRNTKIGPLVSFYQKVSCLLLSSHPSLIHHARTLSETITSLTRKI
jgi:hypothetical protein